MKLQKEFTDRSIIFHVQPDSGELKIKDTRFIGIKHATISCNATIRWVYNKLVIDFPIDGSNEEAISLDQTEFEPEGAVIHLKHINGATVDMSCRSWGRDKTIEFLEANGVDYKAKARSLFWFQNIKGVCA